MYDFNASELSTKAQNKILIGAIGPRPIALVASQSEHGVINLAPFSYFNIVSYKPAVLSVAVQRVKGEMKDTSRNILKNNEAVVHVVDEDNVQEANIAAASLAPDDSELNYADFTTEDSKTISVPGIKEAKVKFETKLYSHTVIYDGDLATADLLLLQVQHYSLSESVYDKTSGYIDSSELSAVGRLAGSDYAKIGEFFSIKRPE